MKALLIAISVGLFAGTGFIQTSGTSWHGITPFHSTRADVERLLGEPSGYCHCQYKLNGDPIRIDYSGNRCGIEKSEHWDVPRDTVLTITLHPQKQCSIADLKLDSKVFQRIDDPELHGYTLYTSDVDGIAYHATEESKVFMIMYYGSLKDRTTLRCK